MSVIKPYQDNIIKYILDNTDKKGILLYHTYQDDTNLSALLSAVAVSSVYNNKHKVLIVTPNVSTIQQLIKSFKLDIPYELLTLKQFNQFNNRGDSFCKNKIVVVDRIHYYRNNSQESDNLIAALNKSFYNILITKSLFINNVYDVITPLAILHRKTWEEMKELFTEAKDNETKLKKLFYGYVSYHFLTESEQKKQLKIYENIIPVIMNQNEYLEYSKIETFFTTEQTTNELYIDNIKKYMLDFKATINDKVSQTSKINWIINKIKLYKNESTRKNIVIYVNQDKDAKALLRELGNNNIIHLYLSGNVSLTLQKTVISKFNNNPNIQILVISSINPDYYFYLPNITSLILMDPQINNMEYTFLIDIISSSHIYFNKNKKGSQEKKRFDVFTLLLKKPKQTKGLFNLVYDYFNNKDMDTIDYLINRKNDISKIVIKKYRKLIKNYSI